MKKKCIPVILGIAMSLCLLTGCGQKEGEYTKAGFAAVEASDYQTALQNFNEAVAGGENLELAYRGLGITYLGMANYTESINSFELALDNAGIYASDLERDINYYMAIALYKNGQLDDASSLFDAIIESDRKNANAYFLRGCIKLDQKDYDSGVYNFEKAISYTSNVHEMKIDVYEALADAGYEEKGQEYLKQMLEDEKSLNDYERGVVYYYLGDYDNARNHLEIAKQEGNKNKGNIIYMLGRTYEQLGDRDYASSLYSDYLSSNNTDARIYNQLGICKMSGGDYSSALVAIEAGIQTGDAAMMQSLKFNQIVAYEKSGDFEKAKSLMETYIQAYPDDEEGQREYTFLSTR